MNGMQQQHVVKPAASAQPLSNHFVSRFSVHSGKGTFILDRPAPLRLHHCHRTLAAGRAVDRHRLLREALDRIRGIVVALGAGGRRGNAGFGHAALGGLVWHGGWVAVVDGRLLGYASRHQHRVC
jgi:hypothetical protein